MLIDKASDHFTYINQLLIVKIYLQVRNQGLRHLEFSITFFLILFDILFITCIRFNLECIVLIILVSLNLHMYLIVFNKFL